MTGHFNTEGNFEPRTLLLGIGSIFDAEALLDETSLQVVLFTLLTKIFSVPMNILKRGIAYLATG
jgi:hypothetical protein